MAGMVPRYTGQLVILETQDNADLVAALERVMKARKDAVSRADVLRQALAPGLRKLQRECAGPELDNALKDVQTARAKREAAKEQAQKLDAVVAADKRG